MSVEAHVELIRDATKKAILEYALMANTSEEPPESFIQHYCALEFYRKQAWNVRIEFPARHTVGWNIDRSRLIHLRKDFRIDLVCFRQAGGHVDDLEMLVEFKRWPFAKDVAIDLDRLREIHTVLMPLRPKARYVGIYSVCVPHYPTLAKVEGSITNFKSYYRVEHAESFMTNERSDRGAAGIVILDASNC